MTITLHTLKAHRGSRTKSFRVGRGLGSGRGKTAGRGTKGQRSRSGGRSGLKMRGLKKMLLGFPKMRGFKSLHEKSATVTLQTLDRLADGSQITLASLQKEGIVRQSVASVKIVGSGVLAKKLHLKGIAVSEGARTAIEKAGGTIV